MKFLLLSLALLVAAVLAASTLLADGGVVVIEFHGLVLKTSLVFFVFALLAAWLLLNLLWRVVRGLWRSPQSIADWQRARHNKKAHTALTQGLLALTRGEWAQAEKILAAAAAQSAEPALYYLGAAKAAQAQTAPVRVTDYVRRARALGHEAEQAALLTLAEVAVDIQDWAGLKPVLDRLAEMDSDHPQYLRMQYHYQRALGHWQEALAIFNRLLKRKLLNAAEKNLYQQHILQAYSQAAQDAARAVAVVALWTELPKDLQQHPLAGAAYARALMQRGRVHDAEKFLRDALKRHWHPAYLRAYGELQASEDLGELRHAESWLNQHADDGDLLFALARLAARDNALSKSRAYLQQLHQQQPSVESYALLAAVLERSGDMEAAQRAYRAGLQLAASR